MNPLNLHPADLCDTIYFWLMENLDEKSASKLDNTLWLPPNDDPENLEDHPLYSPEAELAALEAGIGGGPTGSWE